MHHPSSYHVKLNINYERPDKLNIKSLFTRHLAQINFYYIEFDKIAFARKQPVIRICSFFVKYFCVVL